MKTKSIITAAVVAGFMLMALNAGAQGSSGPPPPGGGDTGAPIDGGAIALLASAAAYGYRKMKSIAGQE